MKNLLKIVLLLVIVGLAYWAYRIPADTIKFNKNFEARYSEVVQRLKDIREAERAYKRNYNKYTGSFDTLINFLKNDTMVYERAMGSLDDSVAVAKGLVRSEKVKIAIKDTIFYGRKVNFDNLRYVPFTDNTRQFELGAREIKTESEVVVPVFEAKVTFPVFLNDLGQDQEVINLVDKYESTGRFPGLKVGDLEQPNNDAGNWEN